MRRREGNTANTSSGRTVRHVSTPQTQRQKSSFSQIRRDAEHHGSFASENRQPTASPSGKVRIRDTEVIAPNFKMRLSGVTSTIIQLVPLMKKLGVGIATLGPGLPHSLPRVRYRQLPALFLRPKGNPNRVWHARRNTEMLGGLILRYLFRFPLQLLFTSASQRKHTGYTKWLIRRMDAVVATSRKTAAYLEVPHTVVMHGIDTSRFCPIDDLAAAKRTLGLDPTKKIVGCFGRIRHQKGTDLFVDSMIAALPERPEWIAIIAGRTTAEHKGFEKQLRHRIEAAGLADRILFVGEHTDIERWYQVLSLFIAPQRWEGFGLTPLEAMACGVPTIANDVGAFSELIVEGKTGVVIEPDNVETMTAAAKVYMDDESFLEKSGEAAIEHIHENFPLEREAETLCGIYRQLMAKSPPRFKDRYWFKTLKWHLYKKRHGKPTWAARYLFDGLVRKLTPEDVVIDCGANVGKFAELLSQRGSTVHAFEPDPYTFERLCENTSHLSNVICHNKAVGVGQATVKLYRTPDFDDSPEAASISSSVFADKTNVDEENYVEVEQIDLAGFIEDLGCQIRLLKIDIEGAEVPLLEHMIQEGSIDSTDMIFAETHDTRIPTLAERTMWLRDIAAERYAEKLYLDWE